MALRTLCSKLLYVCAETGRPQLQRSDKRMPSMGPVAISMWPGRRLSPRSVFSGCSRSQKASYAVLADPGWIYSDDQFGSVGSDRFPPTDGVYGFAAVPPGTDVVWREKKADKQLEEIIAKIAAKQAIERAKAKPES